MVRRLAVGHQAAGMYRSRSRAVYWDGRNHLGESVASGLYFYTLTAGEFYSNTEDADTEISSRHIVLNPDFIGAPYAVNSAK